MLSGGCVDQGYIEFFLANFNINQFTRLRSLTLYKVNNIEMNQFFQHVATSSLVSLTVNTREREDNTVFSIIFSVDIQNNLQKLSLNNLDYTTNEIAWPIQSTLEQLKIRDCTYHQYRNILCNSLRLRTRVMKNSIMNNTDETVSSYAVTTPDSVKRQRTSIEFTGTELNMVHRGALFVYFSSCCCFEIEISLSQFIYLFTRRKIKEK
jgi:hypothetical protein